MLCVRDGTRVAGHGSCNDRGAVVSCGGISAPVLLRFGGRGTGFLSRLKVKKVAGWNFAAMHRRRHVACRHVWFKALTTIAATKLISA